jgi:hypothetical protein
MENFHISQTFRLLAGDNTNFLGAFNTDDYRHISKRMIECVLATDMAYHDEHINHLEGRFESLIVDGILVEDLVSSNDEKLRYNQQKDALSVCIHAADISNPAKPTRIYKAWVERVFIEFHKQGDMERACGLQISPLCDRTKTNIRRSQIFFIEKFVQPTYKLLIKFLPHVEPYYKNVKKHLDIYRDEDEEIKRASIK